MGIIYEKVHREFNLIAAILEIMKKPDRHLLNIPAVLETHICGYWLVLLKRTGYEGFTSLRQPSREIASNPEILGLSETAAQVQCLRVDSLCIKNLWTTPVTEFWGIYFESKLNQVLNIKPDDTIKFSVKQNCLSPSNPD